MDNLIENNLKKDEPDEDIMVGDNAMSVKRGASFLMGYDPYKDPEKTVVKASIGDAPMGEKPKENPLDANQLSLHSGRKSSNGNDESDTSFGGETTIAKASNVGENPFGLNPFGLDPAELERLGIVLPKDAAATPAPVKKPELETVKEEAPKKVEEPQKAAEPQMPKEQERAKEPAKAEEPVKVIEPEEIPLGNIISLSDYNYFGSMIISGSFGSGVITRDTSSESGVTSNDESFKGEIISDTPTYGGEIISQSPSFDADTAFDNPPAEKKVAVETPSVDKESTKESPSDESNGILRESNPDEDDDMQIHFGEGTLESTLGGGESYYNNTDTLEDDEDFRPLGNGVDEEESGLSLAGLDSDDDDPMGLMSGATDSRDDKKTQAGAPAAMDPIMALLLAGGNPFGDDAKKAAPDLSFGKEALKPKHFEPMKASGPAVTAEHVEANHPLGDNPFGKEIMPDFSLGKEALKPKKYVPKKTFEKTGSLIDEQDEEDDPEDERDI